MFACPITLQQSIEQHGWKISPKARKRLAKASVPAAILAEEASEDSHDDRIRF